jgi:hypothetical protein
VQGCGLNSTDSGKGPVVGSSEHGSEASDSINCREFFDQLSNYHLSNKDSALRTLKGLKILSN